MTSVSDSTVTFQAKALQHGIPQSAIDAWAAAGISTYSQLLFRVASAPNQVDANKLQALLDNMQPKADATVTSSVHRLLFEAGTFIVSELRQSLEAPATEPSRRLSTQERSSRLQALQAKLAAFRIAGQFEPSPPCTLTCPLSGLDLGALIIGVGFCGYVSLYSYSGGSGKTTGNRSLCRFLGQWLLRLSVFCRCAFGAHLWRS